MKLIYKYLFTLIALSLFNISYAKELGAHYSTQGDPKAGGLIVEIDYPSDWKELPMHKTGLVKAFQKVVENDKMLFLSISVSTFDETDEEYKELLKDGIKTRNFIDFYLNIVDGVLISHETLSVSNYPAVRIYFKKRVAGMESFFSALIINYKNSTVEISKGFVLSNGGKLGDDLEKYKKLFSKIDSSVVVSDEGKISQREENSLTLYSSDYEEFLFGQTSSCRIGGMGCDKDLAFSFKYPKSWTAVDVKNKTTIKMFGSCRISEIIKTFGILKEEIPPQLSLKLRNSLSDLNLAREFFKDKYKDAYGFKLINIDDFNGVSFLLNFKLNNSHMLMKNNGILCGNTLFFFSIAYTGNDKHALEIALEKDDKLYDAILKSVRFENKAALKAKSDLFLAVANERENPTPTDTSSSLKDGEWSTISIPEICSFQIPPTLEPSSGTYRKIEDGLLKEFGFESSTLTFQQKGLNKYDPDALKEYCRIFIDVEKNEDTIDGLLPIKDPIPLSQEDLDEIYLSLKQDAKEFENFSQFGQKAKIISIKKPRIKRINGIDCLYFEQERQLGNNPIMRACKYSFFNYDMIINVRINYRVKDMIKWESDINKVLESFKFFDRSTSNKNIPENAYVVECKKRMGHLYVPVKLSGSRGKFETELMFDSGATITAIPAYLYNSLETKSPKKRDTFSTAAGEKEMDVSELDIEIAGIKRRTEVAVASGIDDGVVGLNFFRGYNYIIDMQKNKIYFWEK